MNFVMGNLINSYIINAVIIIAYFHEYKKLQKYYLSLQLKFN